MLSGGTIILEIVPCLGFEIFSKQLLSLKDL
jgi:hypothetical protein